MLPWFNMTGGLRALHVQKSGSCSPGANSFFVLLASNAAVACFAVAFR